MRHQLQVWDDPGVVADRAARYVAHRATHAVAARGEFHMAVSGGRTPWTMFGSMAALDVPWDRTRLFQVDERVAPEGDDDRNLTHLLQALGDLSPAVSPMPVDRSDLVAAADEYAATLPEHFDLVHLGLGPDGHTASLVPNDPVLAIEDCDVALTGHRYQGRRRMTLTYRGLRRARQILWLVTGADKQRALAQLLAGDSDIPAGRVTAEASLVMADRSAAPEGSTS